jgi:hypothetical protein
MPNYQDNLPQILNLEGNIIVLTKQMHTLAREQFANEHQAGSRSSSRGILLAEIGTRLQGIEHDLKKIADNIDMLKEIPVEIDPDAAEKPGDYQIF